MFLLEWTASDLLFIVVAAAAIIGTVIWLVPSAQVVRRDAYAEAEITAYDRQIPRYFLAAALALILGSLHILVKNIPPFWQWLWRAGYGGHLFRDLSNSHIIIVGGGTVLLTGITWYVLPRLVNRPLYSEALAGASFWFTVIGVLGFYAAWLVLGLVEGNMVAHGWDYQAAKEALGAWHTVPTRITSSIMGVGYWTYVLNVVLTAWVGRHVRERPLGYLVRFCVVSALALFVGTVQGVLQVLPANADWIHAAGKFGEYVDPISHAHINLVTGMLVSLAAFLVYFAPRMGGRMPSRRAARLLFWGLLSGSLLFYLSFLLLGLVLGGAANGYGGIQSPALATLLGPRLRLILAVAGSAMLAGIWIYFIVMWRSLSLRHWARRLREATPAGFWLAASFALVLGTFQGLLQVIPATARILTVPEEVPNIHAQLNMIGGVLLALMGIVYLLLPELTGESVTARLRRLSLYGVGAGIAGYYSVTLVSGLMRWRWLVAGLDDVGAAARLGWMAPALLFLTGLPLLVGFGAFGLGIFRSTAAYRAETSRQWRGASRRYAGPMPARLERTPLGAVLGLEFAGGLLGWPGLGWLYAGQALPAIGLLLAGPSVAWALLPMLFSPFTDTALSPFGWATLLVWLPASAALSSAALGLFLRRRRPRPVRQHARASRPRIPRRLLAGAGLVLIALISVPLVPLVGTLVAPATSAGQPLLAELPERADGAYLSLDDGAHEGLVKLYPWSFPVDTMPEESPAINPAHLRHMLISQKGLDEPGRYMLYRLEDEEGVAVPLKAAELAFQRELSLTPSEALPPGDYMLDVPIGGMFAGRQYYYFRVDPAVTALPPLVPAAPAAAPTSAARALSWLELLPALTALISGAMVLIMARRLRRRRRPQEVAWALAFLMFALAAAAQVVGDVAGWTPTLARLYYLCGATLVVGWLGLGTWLVVVRRSWLRTAGIWLMLLLTGYGVGLASMAPVERAALATDGWHALVSPTALTILTIAINSVGTLILVGGALVSAWTFWRRGVMRARMIGLLLLAAGALTVAAGGSLTRLGHEQYLYAAMCPGVALMFWGYLKTIQPAVSPQPVAADASGDVAAAGGMVVEAGAGA